MKKMKTLSGTSKTLIALMPIISIGISMGGILTACGTSTNPTAGYQDLRKRALPQNGYSPQYQPLPTGAQVPIEAVFPAPNTFGEVLNFIEGEARTYSLDMPILMTGATFSISPEGLPPGATLEPVSDSRYELKWLPKNVLTQGKKIASFKFKVVLTATGFKDSKVEETFQKIPHSHELTINVVNSHKIPLIQTIKIASGLISEGEVSAITVTVLDLNSTSASTAPQLRVLDGSSTQASGLTKTAHLVKFAPAEYLGNSLFQFKGQIQGQPSAEKLPAGEAAKSLVARFALQAVSGAAKESSPVSPVEVVIVGKKVESEP